MRSHQLGTLHKRGRPRKFPPHHPQPLVVKISKEEEEEVVGDLVGQQGELGVVEIKTDPLQEGEVEGLVGGSLLGGPGPTYITVHTVDGASLGEGGVVELGEGGQLQHVVMETPDGMTDNVVLQVIRDLTGATTVYQQVSEAAPAPPPASAHSVIATSSSSPPVALPLSLQQQQPQIIMSAAPAVTVAHSGNHHHHHHGHQQPQQIIVTSPQKMTAVVTQPQ